MADLLGIDRYIHVGWTDDEGTKYVTVGWESDLKTQLQRMKDAGITYVLAVVEPATAWDIERKERMMDGRGTE